MIMIMATMTVMRVMLIILMTVIAVTCRAEHTLDWSRREVTNHANPAPFHYFRPSTSMSMIMTVM